MDMVYILKEDYVTSYGNEEVTFFKGTIVKDDDEKPFKSHSGTMNILACHIKYGYPLGFLPLSILEKCNENECRIK